ncbi:MAG TPA: hypothetical protein VIM58_01580 [Candidatus Methylacidiphilales bacterium]
MNTAEVAEAGLLALMALIGGAVAFLAVYWIWLRRFGKRVGDLQDTVVALAAALAPSVPTVPAAEAKVRMPGSAAPVTDEEAMALPARPEGALRMLVEGRDIEIVSSGGRDEIRIEETPERPLTVQERDRIIAYLRTEGFLP